MTIPASRIVTVNPGVITSGGNPMSLNGVILTQNVDLPTGGVASFASADAVGKFFGSNSAEHALANVYFNGFDNSTKKPGTLYFSPYVGSAREGWLKSGSFAGVTLAQIQAMSGSLSVTLEGTPYNASSINLATASSFSSAAVKIAEGLGLTDGATCVWDAVGARFKIFTADAGDAGTVGGFATGTIAASLKFTEATGATISQGADPQSPAEAMAAVKAATMNWVAFATTWEPDLENKLLFAEWVNSQNQRFAYVAWDTDSNAIVQGNTGNFGYIVNDLAYDGIVPVYAPTAGLAAFVLGCIASTDYAAKNGRATAMFKHQAGFMPTVTDDQIGQNLLENGYSFYGKYSTANDQFNFLTNGQMSGRWAWVDTFANQVRLNSQFQLALVSLLTSINSVPYNAAGYSLIRAAMMDPINEALNYGGIRAGVTLSSSQKAQVNQAAGLDVAPLIEQQGYYLQILDPGAQVRGLRGTPVINFWFTDGGAVQQITLASIDVM